jgi:hypothetical protein
VYLRVTGNMIRAMSAMEASMHSLDFATRKADDLAWEVEYRSLPADEYPHLAEAGDQLTTISDPRVFDTAVELMLDAIEQRAAALPKKSPGKARKGSAAKKPTKRA